MGEFAGEFVEEDVEERLVKKKKKELERRECLQWWADIPCACVELEADFRGGEV